MAEQMQAGKLVKVNAKSGVITIGVAKEGREGEQRVSITPDVVKKFVKKGFKVVVEKNCGNSAGFLDDDYIKEGAAIADASSVLKSDVVIKINRPSEAEMNQLSSGALLICLAEPYLNDQFLVQLAEKKVSCLSLELIPRTSRAQSMDVLSSQANIAGYRAVLEATQHYVRFFPMMMTSAGSAKPAQVIVLGAGVAGLQAIGTAKRLGSQVFAYDVRPEVKEQIMSLGAKFIELEIGESGTGQGGYAKELSEQAKKNQQEKLSERLKKADIIICTANIPGKKAPVLVTEDAVKGMRAGSVIIDMAAANGGNCPLSEPNKVVVKHGVKLVGWTNYASMVASDASSFFAKNVWNLMSLLLSEAVAELKLPFDDDIVEASLVTCEGEVRFKKK